MNALLWEMIAICCQLTVLASQLIPAVETATWQGGVYLPPHSVPTLTSRAVPVSSSASSSPSSLAPRITSSGAPRNSGHGVRSTVASASDLSLHPRSTRTARISHSFARETDSVAMEIWCESVTNWTLLRSRQKTVCEWSSALRKGALAGRDERGGGDKKSLLPDRQGQPMQGKIR